MEIITFSVLWGIANWVRKTAWLPSSHHPGFRICLVGVLQRSGLIPEFHFGGFHHFYRSSWGINVNSKHQPPEKVWIWSVMALIENEFSLAFNAWFLHGLSWFGVYWDLWSSFMPIGLCLLSNILSKALSAKFQVQIPCSRNFPQVLSFLNAVWDCSILWCFCM